MRKAKKSAKRGKWWNKNKSKVNFVGKLAGMAAKSGILGEGARAAHSRVSGLAGQAQQGISQVQNGVNTVQQLTGQSNANDSSETTSASLNLQAMDRDYWY